MECSKKLERAKEILAQHGIVIEGHIGKNYQEIAGKIRAISEDVERKKVCLLMLELHDNPSNAQFVFQIFQELMFNPTLELEDIKPYLTAPNPELRRVSSILLQNLFANGQASADDVLEWLDSETNDNMVNGIWTETGSGSFRAETSEKCRGLLSTLHERMKLRADERSQHLLAKAARCFQPA